MATTESYINNPSLKKGEFKKRGLIQSARAKIVATGIATAIGLGGIGYFSQNDSNNPESTPLSGIITTPSEKPFSSIKPTESNNATPSEAQSVTPSPTEKPLPNWAKEIPQSELNINDVPLTKETIEKGAVVYTPLSINNEYIMSNQSPTLVAVDVNENGVWIATSLNNKELSISEKNIKIDNEEKKFYKYEGLTIWYFIDKNTEIFLKDKDSEKKESLGIGLENIAKYLKIGSSFTEIFSTFTPVNSENVELIEMNQETINKINSSEGKKNIRTDKNFQMYANFLTVN